MPVRRNKLAHSLHVALSSQEPVWTQECLEPEALLDWIEQGQKHPGAGKILSHLTTCAYCRQHYGEIAEIRAPVSLQQADPLPLKVRRWVQSLTADGIAQPVRWAQAVLAQIDHASETSLLPSTRGPAPHIIRPAFTVVRSLQPTLRWSGAARADEYIVDIVSQNRPRMVWRGSAGSNLYLALPEPAILRPGGVYLWQVTARAGDAVSFSPAVAFAVLTEPIRQQVTALERELANSPLALIGLYETYGLYEEALQQIDRLIELNADDLVVRAIRSNLAERLHISDSLDSA
ncbi:MAG: hypothetical protein JWL77_3728 [Chthonomonadaceae bacterium]|nr:hypothetical protein [Chthonomonadaceae bacterium]